MKILFLTRTLNCGGAERQLVTLARELYARHHEVVVATMYTQGALKNDLLAAGVRVCSLDKAGRGDVVGFAARLFALMRRERPDVVHGYVTVPNLLTMLLKLFFPRVRAVLGVRDSNLDVARSTDRLSLLTRAVERTLARLADLVIVNSQAGFEHAAAKGVPAEKMLIVPNGIDTERFHPESEERERMRALWNVPPGAKLVGLVGRLDPAKDHATFIRAASLVARQHDDVRFICVGGGSPSYRAEMQALAEAEGVSNRLVWESARDDMLAVYNALDLLVSSSQSEGFSNVVAEAMACGVPCVVTDVGDSALIAGPLGMVVPPRDPAALAAAVEQMLVRIERGCRTGYNRDWIENYFSVQELAAKTETALSRLVTHHVAA